jgi:hypothetical protein
MRAFDDLALQEEEEDHEIFFSSVWSCTSCTYKNTLPGLEHCEVCGDPRLYIDQNSQWVCSACTCINIASVQRCVVCTFERFGRRYEQPKIETVSERIPEEPDTTEAVESALKEQKRIEAIDNCERTHWERSLFLICSNCRFISLVNESKDDSQMEVNESTNLPGVPIIGTYGNAYPAPLCILALPSSQDVLDMCPSSVSALLLEHNPSKLQVYACLHDYLPPHPCAHLNCSSTRELSLVPHSWLWPTRVHSDSSPVDRALIYTGLFELSQRSGIAEIHQERQVRQNPTEFH